MNSVDTEGVVLYLAGLLMVVLVYLFRRKLFGAATRLSINDAERLVVYVLASILVFGVIGLIFLEVF